MNNSLYERPSNKRKLPVANILSLVIIITVQFVLGIFAFAYEPIPACRIGNYSLSMTPSADGNLDADYSFSGYVSKKHTSIDALEITMPDLYFDIVDASLSSNIKSCRKITDNKGYTALRVYFNTAYTTDDIFDFSFSLRHKDIRESDKDGFFYDFTAPWFNFVPVDAFFFMLNNPEECKNTNADEYSDEFCVWRGTLACGEFKRLTVQYGNSFVDAESTVTEPSAYNGLELYRKKVIYYIVLLEIILICINISILDCIISFFRGKGILKTRNIYVHIEGRKNPSYNLFRKINAPVGTRINIFGKTRLGPSIVEIYEKYNSQDNLYSDDDV